MLKIGTEVEFGRVHGEKTLGVIVGFTRGGKAKVSQSEPRGRYPIGTVWTVPMSLLVEATGSSASSSSNKRQQPSPPLPPQPLPTQRREGTRAFQIGDRVEVMDPRGPRFCGIVIRVSARTVSVRPDGSTESYFRVHPAILNRI